MKTKQNASAPASGAHTPGPWRYSPSGTANAPVLRVVDSAGKEIACTQHAYRDQPENIANARLIAAAPELLAALKLALPRLQAQDRAIAAQFRGADTSESTREIESAIAKAEGRR